MRFCLIPRETNDSGKIVPSSGVGVVLVNWNSEALTRDCLDSLLSGEVLPALITVVDNGSEPPLDLERMDRVQVLRSEENLGFTGGNNLGIRALLKQGMDYIWILNNDTVVDRCCLRELLASFSVNADQGVAVPKILYHDTPERIWYAGGHLSRLRMTGVHWGTEKPEREPRRPGQPLNFASGCSMFIRSSELRRCGLFCDAYFAYYEDVEWSFRATAAGVVMRYVSTARVYHRVSAVLKLNLGGPGRFPPRYHFLAMRNRCYTARLHGTGLTKVVALCWAVSVCCLLSAGMLAKCRFRKLRAAIAGMREGLWGPVPQLPQAESDL